jgi:hypothetical protein
MSSVMMTWQRLVLIGLDWIGLAVVEARTNEQMAKPRHQHRHQHQTHRQPRHPLQTNQPQQRVPLLESLYELPRFAHPHQQQLEQQPEQQPEQHVV